MATFLKQHWGALLTVTLVVITSLTLVSIPTNTLFDYIGTENIFVFVYLLALIGSITTFASIPYPLLVLGLVAGGADPLTAGIAAALGVITADSLTFLAARKGSDLVTGRLQESVKTLSAWIDRHPRLLTPGLLLYGTLSPLSNDFAVISLSLMRYSYLRVIPFLAVGNIIYNLSIAYLGVYAYDWIVNLI